jgi:hypothetical protein
MKEGSFVKKRAAAVIIVATLLVGCASPTAVPTPPLSPTAVELTPTVTATPSPTATPVQTPTSAAQPTDTSSPAHTPTPAPPTPTALPDFVLQGARERYSFDQIVPLLSSPSLVSLFTANNITYDGRWDLEVAGGNEYAPAWVVYERGVDDCDGHATIQAYFLKANGYEAYNVGISIVGPNPLGHNVAGYRDKLDPSKVWSLNNNGELIGPFHSWEELAQWYIDHGFAYADGPIWLFDPFAITQIATDSTHPSVLELPHTVVRE